MAVGPVLNMVTVRNALEYPAGFKNKYGIIYSYIFFPDLFPLRYGWIQIEILLIIFFHN